MNHLLVSAAFVALAASSVHAERNTLCDDGLPVDITCDFAMPDSLDPFSCGSKGVLALQTGCYLCVDATTCLATLTLDAEVGEDAPLELPTANGDEIAVILQDQADAPEDVEFEQAAVVPAGDALKVEGDNVELAKSTKSAEPTNVPDWLFAVPVGLALVSLGLALRTRVSSRRRGFKRLQDRNGHLHEDINPFCANNSRNDLEDGLETAGRFEGERSSDSEEARFLDGVEVEDDEATRAEAEAIKQAVMLHIKEFDEDEEAEI
ncbi:hypothetical protein BBJ28_00000591 [Nothophytophthora sp. Chile5]|nr:hypothetical protein BBJ28_00000591 [Nothophytophthora sp. Chile5]